MHWLCEKKRASRCGGFFRSSFSPSPSPSATKTMIRNPTELFFLIFILFLPYSLLLVHQTAFSIFSLAFFFKKKDSCARSATVALSHLVRLLHPLFQGTSYNYWVKKIGKLGGGYRVTSLKSFLQSTAL